MKHIFKNASLKLLFCILLVVSVCRSMAQSAAINTTGTAADNSAMLDITSSSKGLLIPRMTAAQRSAISSPAGGLMVYQTDQPAGYYFFNGSVWTPLLTGSRGSCGYTIGQKVTALGGIIFYLDAQGCHGLVSAPTDQSTGIQWYNGTNTNTTAFGDCIGCGAGNTSLIINNQGAIATNYAAGLARACTVGGFSDWYLPSKFELRSEEH